MADGRAIEQRVNAVRRAKRHAYAGSSLSLRHGLERSFRDGPLAAGRTAADVHERARARKREERESSSESARSGALGSSMCCDVSIACLLVAVLLVPLHRAPLVRACSVACARVQSQEHEIAQLKHTVRELEAKVSRTHKYTSTREHARAIAVCPLSDSHLLSREAVCVLADR